MITPREKKRGIGQYQAAQDAIDYSKIVGDPNGETVTTVGDTPEQKAQLRANYLAKKRLQDKQRLYAYINGYELMSNEELDLLQGNQYAELNWAIDANDYIAIAKYNDSLIAINIVLTERGE